MHSSLSPTEFKAVPTPLDSRHFLSVLGHLRPSGGTINGEALADLLAAHGKGGYISLARLVASEQVFGFHWRGQFWVPMFQFDSQDLSLRHGPLQVRTMFPRSTAGWHLACWWTDANEALGGARPVDVVRERLPAVLAAAHRFERYPFAAPTGTPTDQPRRFHVVPSCVA